MHLGRLEKWAMPCRLYAWHLECALSWRAWHARKTSKCVWQVIMPSQSVHVLSCPFSPASHLLFAASPAAAFETTFTFQLSLWAHVTRSFLAATLIESFCLAAFSTLPFGQLSSLLTEHYRWLSPNRARGLLWPQQTAYCSSKGAREWKVTREQKSTSAKRATSSSSLLRTVATEGRGQRWVPFCWNSDNDAKVSPPTFEQLAEKTVRPQTLFGSFRSTTGPASKQIARLDRHSVPGLTNTLSTISRTRLSFLCHTSLSLTVSPRATFGETVVPLESTDGPCALTRSRDRVWYQEDCSAGTRHSNCLSLLLARYVKESVMGEAKLAVGNRLPFDQASNGQMNTLSKLSAATSRDRRKTESQLFSQSTTATGHWSSQMFTPKKCSPKFVPYSPIRRPVLLWQLAMHQWHGTVWHGAANRCVSTCIKRCCVVLIPSSVQWLSAGGSLIRTFCECTRMAVTLRWVCLHEAPFLTDHMTHF